MNFLDDEYNTDVQKELEPENSKRKVIENVDGNLGLIKLAALDKLPDYSEDDWDDWDDDYYYEKDTKKKKRKKKKKKKERKLKKAIATIEKNKLLIEQLQELVKKSNMYIAYLDGKVTGLTDLTTKLCSNSMNDIIHLDSDGEKELKW